MLALTVVFAAATPAADLLASAMQSAAGTETVAEQQKKKASAKRKSGGAKKAGKKSGRKAAPRQSAPETSADVRRQQEATQREVNQTKARIRENDRSISQGLSNLSRIDADIKTTHQEVNRLSGQVKSLQGSISSLEQEIAAGETELSMLRQEYLKAIKKMRVARKRHSRLAFLFSARNFSQGLRRMRYLKEFSGWRERQSSEISAKISDLRTRRTRLAEAHTAMDATLKRQVAARQKLERQRSEQDAIVVDLRRNGEALNAHLARKQAEVNQLRNRVSTLIAQEEAKRIEAERKAAAEAEARRVAEEKAAAEREAARQQAEREAADRQRLAEALAQEKSKDKADAQKQAPKKEQPKQTAQQADKKQKNKKADKQQTTRQPADNGRSYAEARKRKPRSKQPEAVTASAPKPSAPKPATPKATASAPAKNAAGAGFGSMQGQLPRPVAGSFRITSPFGLQTLPDLPDVRYDNPGIDAEVAKGASALAVYPGKVSAVYVLAGFNTVIIVNHGEYYTVYGNIESPAVSMGQTVTQGQSLGRLAPDDGDGNHSSIHFEVWKRRDKLNPMSWIR